MENGILEKNNATTNIKKTNGKTGYTDVTNYDIIWESSFSLALLSYQSLVPLAIPYPQSQTMLSQCFLVIIYRHSTFRHDLTHLVRG